MKSSDQKASDFMFIVGTVGLVFFLLWSVFISVIIIQHWELSEWGTSDWIFFIGGPVLGSIGMLISIGYIIESIRYAEKAEMDNF